MNTTHYRFRLSIPALALLLSTFTPQLSTVSAQGPLTPPGAPAPTMKTLQQVEPRIEINATNTPGDADASFKITQPGSYYLTGNLNGVAGKHGIEIAANDVTLDLMGFALSGVAGSLGGVTVTANVGGLTIRNGTVRGWGQAGIGASNAKGCILENLQAASNAINGILAGENAAVRDCTARLNTGIGISAASGSTIVRCTASGNTTTGIAGSGFAVTISQCAANSNGGIGIRANNNCAVSDCASRQNGSHGIELGNYCALKSSTSDANTGTAKGIVAGANCVIAQCVATGNPGGGIEAGDRNTLGDCTASGNAGDSGIAAGTGASLTNCTASGNTGESGISVGDGSALTNCTASQNAATYGILASSGSSLTNCTAYNNGGAAAYSAGIATGGGSTLSHCSSSRNYSSASPGTPTTGMGIAVSPGCNVISCNANFNTGDGIRVNYHSTVRDNQCWQNGGSGGGDAAGIHAIGDGNRIEGNSVTENDRGFDVDGVENLIIRNIARANGTNYSAIVAGNVAGPVVGTTNPITNTNPWANFSF